MSGQGRSPSECWYHPVQQSMVVAFEANGGVGAPNDDLDGGGTGGVRTGLGITPGTAATATTQPVRAAGGCAEPRSPQPCTPTLLGHADKRHREPQPRGPQTYPSSARRS